MSLPIKVQKLTKTYGRSKTPAVKDLSFSIAEGEVYGLLGANGAGKSTTIRTMLDFIRPTSGTVTLLGKDSKRNAPLRNHVGYLAGDVMLQKGVTGRTLLSYLQRLNGQVDEKYFESLVERFEAQLDKKIETLSKGNRQKIGIIQAFMHQPDVLILDEPTSGLDPLMQEQFYLTIDEAKSRGAAILLSSHSFEEVERICHRIGIVRQGELVYEGLVSEVVANRRPQWRITLKHASDVDKLADNSEVKVINREKLAITVEPSGTIEKSLGAIAKFPITAIATSQRGLEDEFLSLYTDDEEHKK